MRGRKLKKKYMPAFKSGSKEKWASLFSTARRLHFLTGAFLPYKIPSVNSCFIFLRNKFQTKISPVLRPSRLASKTFNVQSTWPDWLHLNTAPFMINFCLDTSHGSHSLQSQNSFLGLQTSLRLTQIYLSAVLYIYFLSNRSTVSHDQGHFCKCYSWPPMPLPLPITS